MSNANIFPNLICFQNTFSIISNFIFRIKNTGDKKQKEKTSKLPKMPFAHFSSFMQTAFNEDKRRKSSPPQWSVKF